MGQVLLGRDVALDRPVAIKVIAPDLASSPASRQRFLREARTVARLRHPNIVAVYAAGEADGLLYFVMEYVEGESLRQMVEREGRAEGDRIPPPSRCSPISRGRSATRTRRAWCTAT